MAARATPDFTPLHKIAELQRRRWRHQRRYVLEHSPLFQNLWMHHAVPGRLEELPVLPLCDKDLLRRSQAAAPPFGNYLAAPEQSVVRLHRTSGTTGQAMNLALSVADAAQTAEVGARAQRAAGLKADHRVIHCLNYRMWIGGFTDHTTLEMTGATVIPFGVGNSELLIRTIRELRITAISCTPSYPAVLERVIEQNFPELTPRALGLKLGLFGGEAGLDNNSFRARLEATWGFKARNANYGVSDVFCNFAAQCEHSNDLHFVGLDVLYPEVVDPDSGDSLPWREGAQGELVLTHLARECQPLVRFRTADIIVITGTQPCACRRTVPRFRVIGRSDDMVVVRGINVFPTAVAAVINDFSELSGEYRILLEGPGPYDQLPLEVELAPDREATETLADAVADAIKYHISVSARVTLAAPQSLPRTAGKTRRVIRKETQ
ncbi:MAG: phenylacetate--CoA ligase family protein [Acidiferrobacterales bacterium]